MSEMRLRKYGPGDLVEVVLHIQHAPMHLHRVTVVFGHEESQRDDLYMVGEPYLDETQPAPQLGVGVRSTAELELRVLSDAVPGVYRVRRAIVETFGGRTHHYSGEELASMASFGFEIVEEPEDKPALAIGYFD